MKNIDKIKSILETPVSWIYSIIYKKPNIMTDYETLKAIKENNLSLSRFGDGEFCLMRGISIKFQDADTQLAKRLKKVANEEIDKHLVAVPYMISNLKKSKQFLSKNSYRFWKKHLIYTSGYYKKFFQRKIYGDTNLSRFYIERSDKDNRNDYVDLLKSLFVDQKLLFVEGGNTHLGVGNDLFGDLNRYDAKCRRILCPSKNAFSKYDEILNAVLVTASKDDLIVAAIGPTATILCRDLASLGYRALDLGHLDVEYMWWQEKANKPQAIKGKDMTEVSTFQPADKEDKVYLSQIVRIIK